MSVTPISSSTDPNQDNPFQKVRSDFKQLADALKSGSTDQAQQALTTLKGDLPNGGANSPFAQVLDQISGALNSGDVSAAQQAFASLQTHRGHRGHHHHSHDGDGQSAPVANTSPTQTTSPDAGSSGVGTTINVTA